MGALIAPDNLGPRRDSGCMQSLDTEVVIVGAGPTGLMLANCLMRLGVACVIVDGKSGPTRESRALVLQARTMEIYDQLGLAERVLEQAEIAATARARVRADAVHGDRAGPARHRGHALPAAVRARAEQERASCWSRACEPSAEKCGGDAGCSRSRRRTTAGRAWSATARARRETDAEDTDHAPTFITARFCVGADGASSPVREATGIPFTGVTNEHTFYVADASGVEGLVPHAVNVRFGETHFLLAFPMDRSGHHRLIGVVRTGPTSRSPRRLFANARAGLRRDLRLRPLVLDIPRAPPRRRAVPARGRVPGGRRRARALPCRGPGHEHRAAGRPQPGVQDRGRAPRGAPDAYLDRYEAERMPVARRLVGTTDTLFGFVTSDRRGPRFLRRRILRVIAPSQWPLCRAPRGHRGSSNTCRRPASTTG